MDRVFSVLPKVLHKRGLQQHAEGALVVHRLEKWIAHRLVDLSACVHVKKVQDGVVFLTCSHSVALQECRALIPDLKAYIASECGFAHISDIRIARD
ncbi:MAG TPA: DciA family protein [Candidatus Peribacteraceae bacterium]|nr:DciA family protein [Candidatus Peribacteraceae bacterium]